jgi:hypothetical protein
VCVCVCVRVCVIVCVCVRVCARAGRESSFSLYCILFRLLMNSEYRMSERIGTPLIPNPLHDKTIFTGYLYFKSDIIWAHLLPPTPHQRTIGAQRLKLKKKKLQ